MHQVRGLVSVMVIALLLAGPATVLAQSDAPRIGSEIVSATQVLNNSQQQEIKNYVSHWAELLSDGDDEQVTQARKRLIEPFNAAGATNIFLTAYSAAVAMQLKPLIDHEDPLIRINGMLVLRFVSERGVVQMVRTGLQDDNPSVRYLAAQAAGAIGGNDRVAAEQKEAILSAVQAALANERNQAVVDQLMLAMLGVADLPAARQALLEHVNARVSVHVQNPQISVKAPLEVQARLYRRLIADVDRDTVRAMLPVAVRYMLLAATVLEQDVAPPGIDAQWKNMITMTDTVLRWGVNELAPELAANAPQKVDAAVAQRDWKLIKVRAEEWHHLLTQPPLNYEPARLTVSLP